MTTPADNTTTVDNTEVERSQQDDPATGGPPAAEPTPNSEAARYRVQLRETEAARDALAERLTGYQRRECEAAIGDLLDVPSDLWEVGQADHTTFYNDDGTVNEAELRAAAGALIEQRPRLGKPPQPRPQWGQHNDTVPGSGPSWGTVINP